MAASVSTWHVRQLLRLQGEAYELADFAAVHPHLLAGLLELVGGVGIIRLQCYDYEPGGARDIRDGIDVGLDDDSRRRLADQYYDCASVDPVVATLCVHHDALQQGGTTVASRGEIVGDAAWYDSGYVTDVRRPARIDDTLYLTRRIEGTRADGMGIHRAWGDPKFTDEDVAVVRLFYQEVQSRFAMPGRDLADVQLSPRERQILAMLVRGTRRKALAAELGLSTHTVDGYIKSLYKRLGVAGLPELLARIARTS